ncbi:MAG: hypothetical protein HQM10_06100 [Candidatus Riflebacteria bacterium]|nr:hypothetical protein [Candidatus Riflebacteria bacterium]
MKTSGFVSYLFIFFLMFLSILAISFHRSSQQQKQSSFKFQQNDNARIILDGALEEAYAWFFKETSSPGSPAGQWLISRSTSRFDIPLEVTANQANSMIRGGFSSALSASARLIDFRSNDVTGAPYSPPSGADGGGTVEIKVRLSIQKSSFLTSPFDMVLTGIKHVEYKVVSMVSPRDNSAQRTAYSQCFPLDYALFVRNGLEEFRKTNGFSLNNEKKKLVVDQNSLSPEKRGKIYFGETDPQKQATGLRNSPPIDNFVFLNVPQSFESLVPPCSQTQQIGHDDVIALFPWLNDTLFNTLKQQESAIRSARFENLKGTFHIQTHPLPKTRYASGTEEYEKTMVYLIAKQLFGADGVYPAESGYFLLGENPDFATDMTNAGSILEGAIRKRFLYLVYLTLDFSEARVVGRYKVPFGTRGFSEDIPQEMKDKFREMQKAVLCIDLPEDTSNIPDPNLKRFLQNLPQVAARFPQVSLKSRFDTNFLYGGGQEDNVQTPPAKSSFVSPKFYNIMGTQVDVHRTGLEGFRPFNFFSLWYRKQVPIERLPEIDLFNFGDCTINARGIVHLLGNLEISAAGGGDWKIKGQGVLIADNFKITTGIQKSSPNDLLVLYTRKGRIVVDTDRPVEAVLVATNDDENGAILAQRPLKLKGGLICDYLDSTRWCDGKHVIEYDPLLKSRTDYQYQICLTRWTNFFRIFEE